MRPHQPGKTRLSPKRRDKWRGWVTRVRIDENPVNKGDTISALTRRAKETASQNALRWGSENDSDGGLAVVWCHATEYVSRLDLCKYYSLYGNMWKLILQRRTLSLVFKIFYEVLGGGTRLAMPKIICAPDSSSLKPGSGATEGVLD